MCYVIQSLPTKEIKIIKINSSDVPVIIPIFDEKFENKGA
jgi:hypothetical protein